MTEPQPYDNGGNVPKGVRVISTFEEWAEWAQSPNGNLTVHVDGAFGDQICDRLGAPRNSIIRAHIAWDIGFARDILNFECWYDRTQCKDISFAYVAPDDLESVRAWLEGGE